MFYLFNVKEWLEEIVDTCGKKCLNPTESVFSLILFSALDANYVKFFRTQKEQISSYSGENVHLFTPAIFDNNVIPDNEWQTLRCSFIESGVDLGSGPSVILFRLKKRDRGPGYDPHFLCAFALPERRPVARLMREFVWICINNRANPTSLPLRLSEMLGKPNLMNRAIPMTSVKLTPFESPLHAPSVFLSYSHADRGTVLPAYDELKKHGLRVWLDKYEIPVGAYVLDEVKRGLAASDAALLFLSANSENSKWLQFEGAYLHGIDADRAIIPVVLDEEGKVLAGKMPLTAGRLYVDMSVARDSQTAYGVLAERVRNAIDRLSI